VTGLQPGENRFSKEEKEVIQWVSRTNRSNALSVGTPSLSPQRSRNFSHRRVILMSLSAASLAGRRERQNEVRTAEGPDPPCKNIRQSALNAARRQKCPLSRGRVDRYIAALVIARSNRIKLQNKLLTESLRPGV